MAHPDFLYELERAASVGDFVAKCYELTDAWSTLGAGIESVESILRFMEMHSSLDLGTPGPLVHFVEQFCGKGYEKLLCESVDRKPTAHTIWMLNRLINGCESTDTRELLLKLMQKSRDHSLVDKRTAELIVGLLKRRIR